MTSTPPQWMSLTQVAAYTQLSLPTLRRAVRSGRLEAYRINGGRIYRVRLEAVEAYVRAFTAAGTDQEGSR